MQDLTVNELVAVSKFFAKLAKDKNKEVVPGTHEGTVKLDAIDISYSFYKQADREVTPTTSLPYLASMVIALHRAGFQRDGIAKEILAAAEVALTEGDKIGDELQETIDYVDSEVKALQRKFSETLPKRPDTGRITNVKISAK
jgi:hypothetical protein